MSYMCVTIINEKKGRELKESKGCAWVGLDGGKGIGGRDTIILSSQKGKKKWELGEEQTAEGPLEIKAETKAAELMKTHLQVMRIMYGEPATQSSDESCSG